MIGASCQVVVRGPSRCHWPPSCVSVGTVETGLSRTFQVREAQNIQFRWEIFNVPNRLNANAPVTALNNANFGKILSAQDPRIMQFALKYTF